MSKVTSQDIYDIIEFVVHNLDSYAESYTRYGSHLTFSDYLLTRTVVQLQHKYNKYDVEQSFADPKLIAIIEFYTTADDEEERNVH